MGTFDGHEYVQAEGVMRGEVNRGDGSSGTYEVPFMMYYPKNDSNGFGVVDVNNNVYYALWRDAEGVPVVCGRGNDGNVQTGCPQGEEFAGHRLENWTGGTPGMFSPRSSEDYPFRNGYTLLSVQWGKMVTDAMGPQPPDGTTRRHVTYGTIERGTDGREIIKDASRWLRDTTEFEGNGAPAPASAEFTIGYGFSQSVFPLRQLLKDGDNFEADGTTLVFDGFFLENGGTPCWPMTDDPPIFATPGPCPGHPPSNGAKVLVIDTESDPEVIGGAFARDFAFGTEEEDLNHIRWEIAGVAHLPAHFFSMSWAGATQQNPVAWYPVIRAGWHHLSAWVADGTRPPPTILFEGILDPKAGTWETARDEDGNALGGIRLPHMPSIVDGEPAGAPTGAYGGTNWTAMPPMGMNEMLALSGSYVRFSDEELAERYPTPEVYANLYIRAAEQAADDGYILQEDLELYRSHALRPVIPDAPPIDETPEEIDDGCSVNGSSGSTLLSALALLGLIVVTRRRVLGGR